jgi:hypothetical protein
MLLQPKNWAIFQHYKDRCPPWIKLHRDLLNDRVFMRLPIASKAIAPMLWLLASESKDGVFDGSLDELVFRLHITPKEYQDGVKPLIDNDFFNVVSGMIAECKQDAIPETERETETKTEKKATSVAPPEGVSLEIWDSFVKHRKAKKAPITPMVMGFFEEQANIAGWTLENALKETCVRGWQSFKAEWVAPKQSFAQQAADVARTTVPGSTGLDPVLVKIEADRKNAVPMPEHIRQQINQVLRKVS